MRDFSAAAAIRAVQPGLGHNGGPALEDHMIAHRRGRVIVIVIAETGRRPIRLARREVEPFSPSTKVGI